MQGRNHFLPALLAGTIIFVPQASRAGQSWGTDESSFDQGVYNVKLRQVLNKNVQESTLSLSYNKEFQSITTEDASGKVIRFSTPTITGEVTKVEGITAVRIFYPKSLLDQKEACVGPDFGSNVLFARFSRGFGVSDSTKLKRGSPEFISNELTYKLHWESNSPFPKRTTIHLNGKQAAAWIYEEPMELQNGLSIPKRSIQLVDLGKEGSLKKVFTIESADFENAPANEICTYNWFQPNHRVIDERVDPPVSFTFEELKKLSGKSVNLSPEELLQISLKQSEKIKIQVGGAKERFENREAMKKNRTIVSILVGLGSFLLVGVGIAGFQKFRGASPSAKRPKSKIE